MPKYIFFWLFSIDRKTHFLNSKKNFVFSFEFFEPWSHRSQNKYQWSHSYVFLMNFRPVSRFPIQRGQEIIWVEELDIRNLTFFIIFVLNFPQHSTPKYGGRSSVQKPAKPANRSHAKRGNKICQCIFLPLISIYTLHFLFFNFPFFAFSVSPIFLTDSRFFCSLLFSFLNHFYLFLHFFSENFHCSLHLLHFSPWVFAVPPFFISTKIVLLKGDNPPNKAPPQIKSPPWGDGFGTQIMYPLFQGETYGKQRKKKITY